MQERDLSRDKKAKEAHGCWYYILFALDLHAGPLKIQKYHFLSIDPQEHQEQRGATRSGIGAPEVPFFAKMTKIPLVSPRFDRRSNMIWTLTKKTFFTVSLQTRDFRRFLTNFDQVEQSLTRRRSRVGPKTRIWIQLPKWIETNTVAKIIEFSFQRLFMGRNRS